VTAPTTDLTAVAQGAGKAISGAASPLALPIWRVNVMRLGYLLMAVGLALTKGPLFLQGSVASLPVYEGVVAALLGSMSLLALLGLRYPVQLLPLLILETLWKLVWLATVAVPNLATGDMGTQMSTVLSSVSLVVVILAVTPWDYVWRRYVRAAGDAWR
jgi:hypothetical protein